MFKTSYQEDFSWPQPIGCCVNKPQRKKSDENEVVKKKATPIYRNIETLSKMQEEDLLPFNLCIEAKPIVHTHPQAPIFFSQVI